MTKPFRCRHCNAVLFERGEDAIVTERFVLELQRSLNVWCGQCREFTRFVVDRGKDVVPPTQDSA